MTTMEFAEKHGANGYYSRGSTSFFEDGSWIEEGGMMYTESDPIRIARAGVEFWKTKLSVAVELFDTAKKRLLAKAADMTAPDPSEVEMNHLHALKAAVTKAKAKLAEAEKKAAGR